MTSTTFQNSIKWQEGKAVLVLAIQNYGGGIRYSARH